jgi:hypothetical protein
MMNKMLLATVSAVALIGVAAAPALAQDANVTIVKPDGTTVEQTESTTESAGEAMENAADATADAAGDAADATGEAMKDAADATADATRDAAEATGDVMKDAADATADAAGDAADATRDAAEATGEAMRDAADATSDAARAAAQTTERAAEGAAETVARTTGEFRVEDVETTIPMGAYLSTELTDEAVQTPDGENIADTESFVISPDGQITHIVIGFGGVLGLGEKQVMLPWDAFEIRGEGALFTINLTKEQVEALPEFERPDRDVSEVSAPASDGERVTTAN